MTPHRVRTDDTGAPIHERRADQGKRARLEVFLEENWRTFMSIIFIVFGWYAANVYRPIQQIPGIVERDSVRAKQHVAIEEKVDRIERAFLILTRINCVTLDRLDRIKYGIDCSDIPIPAPGGTTP